ncbi:MAG: ABC transporter ATP-binding protein [Pseudochelatococcus sp.]|uniref:ABC transporter ATP-binding protein n=1 Tax=Pseudochelatococcus sp. TaxID=2020869 RepID=UPI003D8D0172
MEPIPGSRRDAGAGWLHRLMPFLRPHRRMALIAIGMTIFGQFASATVPLLQKVIVDDVMIAGSRDPAPWIGLLLCAALISAASTVIRRRNGNGFGFSVQHDLRNAVFRHVQALDIGHVGGSREDGGRQDQGDGRRRPLTSGEIISRSTADITLLQTLLSQLHVLLGSLIFVAASLVMMAFLSPLLGLVVAMSLPLLWFTARRLGREIFPAVWNDQRVQAELAEIIEENTTGVRVVRALGQEKRELDRYVGAARTLYGSRLRTARINARYTPLLQAVPGISQMGVLAIGGWLAWHDAISIGTFVAFFSYLAQIVSPVRTLSGALAVVEQARAGTCRIFEILDTKPAITDPPGAPPLAVTRGGIVLSHVSFGYAPGRPLLRDIDLAIRPGETLAVVGASGSGKSTLALLLARFHDPTEGRVLVDGQDISKVSLQSLRRAIVTVFEDVFLFAGTVAENIAKGRPDATAQEIEAAARIAGAHEFIAALPGGYDTPVAELGMTLSGGQRQRLTIARAVLTNARILVLDDVTSAVDAKTEAGVLSSLRQAVRGRTTFIVARRQSTIALADRVLLLENGGIAALGTHEELLRTSDAYRRTVAAGLSGASDAGHDAAGEGAGANAGSGIDPLAWPQAGESREPGKLRFTGGESFHGAGTFRRSMPSASALSASSPEEIRARIAALPPADDRPEVDVAYEIGDRRPFSLGRFLKPYGRGLWAGLALVVGDMLVSLGGPLLIGAGVDNVAAGSFGALWYLVPAFALLLVVSRLIGQTLINQTSRTAERMLFALRVRIFAQLQRLPLDRYEREESGRIMARATSDVDALATLLQQGLLTAVVSLATCCGIFVTLFVVEPHLALAAAGILPLLVVSTEWFRRSSTRAYEQSRQRIASVYAGIQEGVAGARVTRALANENRMAEAFSIRSDRYRASRMAASRIASFYFPFLQFLQVFGKVLVLAVGAGLVARGQVGVGVVVTFLLYLDQFFAPIQQLSQVFDQWLQATVSLRRITGLLAEPITVDAPADPVATMDVAGELRFDNVTFGYPSRSTPALDDVSFLVPPGQLVALVGKTGAGKSTIARLAARFSDPTQGRVLLDGVPLTRIAPAAMRRHIGYVPQEPLLFARTIAENIAYGRPDASPAEIEAVARRCGAHGFIRRLPHGYRTVVAEKGHSLSAGQRQLLCLARVLLTDPKLIVLDEATAQVDREAETAIQHVLEDRTAGRTTIVIAHRLQTALRSDRVLVLDHGRLVEDGPPQELARLNGLFRSLLESSGLPARKNAEAPAGGQPALTVAQSLPASPA